MCEKDYSLLRPFDLEAAKREDVVTDIVAGTFLRFISGPDVNGRVCVECFRGFLSIHPIERLRMAPLCWVEGRPVYKGDVLYVTKDNPNGAPLSVGVEHVANYVLRCGGIVGEGKGWAVEPEFLTCTPPKVNREGVGKY